MAVGPDNKRNSVVMPGLLDAWLEQIQEEWGISKSTFIRMALTKAWFEHGLGGRFDFDSQWYESVQTAESCIKTLEGVRHLGRDIFEHYREDLWERLP